MTALNKQELREAAERAESDSWGYDRDEFNDAITPEVVLALLDELEASDKRIAELEARTVTLPDVEKWRSVDAVRAQNAYKVLVCKVLAAAGIGVKGE
ncbi:ead/Ea22-like family protein [Citrobacter freundii]|nr:ead/Ea22-like family protein [Citrobacter freundii]